MNNIYRDKSKESSISKSFIYPRLLMEAKMDVNKVQKIPKLISKYDPVFIKDENNSISNNQNGSTKNNKLKKQLNQAIKIRQLREQQILQLKKLIDELTIKTEQLEFVNSQLLLRLKQLENNYSKSMIEKDQFRDQNKQKIKLQIHKKINQTVKDLTNHFYEQLKVEKMNAKVQHKIDSFLQQLIKVTQSQIIQSTTNLPQTLQQSIITIHQNLQSQKSKQKMRDHFKSPSKQQYQTVLLLLNESNENLKNKQIGQSNQNTTNRNISPIGKEYYHYKRMDQSEMTPNKRKKIFNN